MSFWKQISLLFVREFKTDWRNKNALSAVLLYLAASIFVVYMGFDMNKGFFNKVVWNTLYWIILVFAAFNAIGKSFVQEAESKMLFLYFLVKPEALIVAKILYNAMFMIVIGLLGLTLYVLVMGLPIQDMTLYLCLVFLSALGFASTLTLISSIAAQAQNSSTLMAVIGFPLILPFLLLVLKVSKNALDGIARSQSWNEIQTISAIVVLSSAVSFMLFRFIWRG
ncbi:MAG: ABC transporter permease [Cytophagales bacterium]|nr:MAG: ABC transporter permease [Cytophagales bacterium]TAF61465.1 MAG: ABC transporter permease [Cytophagales bacterium]